MRSTSATAASSRRLSASGSPVACSSPGNVSALSIGFHLLCVAMMPQPGSGEAFPAFFLEQLIHETVILRGVAGDTVEDEPTEAQGKRPLPHFPQFVIVV